MIFDANQDDGWLPPTGPVTFKWSGNRANLLLYPPGVSKPYPIHINRVKTPLHLLNWLDHLLGKIWFDRRAARKLISMVCDRRGWEYLDDDA